MIKLPFHRKPTNEGCDVPSVAFETYCQRELERRRDAGVESVWVTVRSVAEPGG